MNPKCIIDLNVQCKTINVLEQNIGKQVEAKLFKKDENGNKNYIGELKKFNEQTVTIDEVKIERKNIAQLKTIYEWGN